MPSTAAEVQVAVGVLRDAEGRVLLTRRHQCSHQGGLWEFPGGKVEAGESLFAALCRELYEELGVTVLEERALLVVRHDYGDKRVCLDVREVTRFRGDASPREGQPMQWVPVADLGNYAFPVANAPIIEKLQR